uniref:C-type lectin domain-containing protein n=1 Tax=Anabas testudineus TaxID=64144 RepID=A0A3Q1JNA3_ANATE
DQGRWPPTLSLVLLELSSVKGSFSSPLSPRSALRDQLKTNLNEMTEEKNQLKTNLNEMTEERNQLKTNLNEMTEENNRLQCLFRLSDSSWSCVLTHICFVSDKTCPAGWTKFSCSCYFLSTESGSWTEGRQDCRTRGADLVVIDSDEEQFLLLQHMWSWIGLTDGEQENSWKWIDGTPLTLSYWEEDQPDNGGGDVQWGEEDCAHIRTGKKTKDNWNDRSCKASLHWICEKKA